MTNIGDEVRDVAKRLSRAEVTEGTYKAESLPSRPWTRLARSRGGFAFILPESEGPLRPDIELEHLRVRFNVTCNIDSGETLSTESLTLVECTAQLDSTQQLFLSVGALALPPTLNDLGGQLQQSIVSLVDLFKSMLVPGPTAALGLWGELFVMATAMDAGLVARAWHTNSTDRYDFSAEGVRLEIKSTTGARIHHFSLDQLQPHASIRVLVGSILTQPSPSGRSVSSLLNQIAAQVDDDTRSRVVMLAMRSLGSGWPAGSRISFDAELASATLRWFDSPMIPTVENPPPEVSAVRFQSDLQDCEPLTASDLRQAGGLVAALPTGQA